MTLNLFPARVPFVDKDGKLTAEAWRALRVVQDNVNTAIAAEDVTFAPVGGLAATDVQAMGAELDAEKQPIDPTLTALAGADWAANALPIGSGVDTVAQVPFAANTFPARASVGNLVAKPITDFGLSLVATAAASALTKTDDTNVTLTLGGTPATALLQATSITVGWSGLLASSRGGTGNGFTKFSGPATAEKTFTLPNASATILTDNAAVTVAQGGTGRQTGTTAFALVATGTTATGAQQTLAAGATTEILVGGGAAALPVWTTASGSGAPVRATSPALVTPNIGTPSAGTLTSCTGLPVLTGISGLAAGVAAFLATPSSANLATALTDELGSGFLPFTAVAAWTPVLTFATPGTLAVVYSTQNGYRVRIGNFMFASFEIVTSTFTLGTASGNLQVTGVGVNADANMAAYYGALTDFRGITKASYTHFGPTIATGGSLIEFRASGSAQVPATLTTADLPTGGTVVLRGFMLYNA